MKTSCILKKFSGEPSQPEPGADLLDSSRLSSGGSIFFNDESLSFFLVLQVVHLGFNLACLLSSLLTLAASAAAAFFMFLTWAVHSTLICSKIWPQSAASSFGGSGHASRV